MEHTGQNKAKQEFKLLFQHANVFDRDRMEPLLHVFLKEYPDYPPALRLRGLLLEYEVSQEKSHPVKVAAYDPRLQDIRASYEAALQLDPYYILALIDLGEFWNDLANQPDTAIEYFDRALLLLKAGQFTEDRSIEMRDAYKGKLQSLMSLGRLDDVAKCRAQAILDCGTDDGFHESTQEDVER